MKFKGVLGLVFGLWGFMVFGAHRAHAPYRTPSPLELNDRARPTTPVDPYYSSSEYPSPEYGPVELPHARAQGGNKRKDTPAPVQPKQEHAQVGQAPKDWKKFGQDLESLMRLKAGMVDVDLKKARSESQGSANSDVGIALAGKGDEPQLLYRPDKDRQPDQHCTIMERLEQERAKKAAQRHALKQQFSDASSDSDPGAATTAVRPPTVVVVKQLEAFGSDPASQILSDQLRALRGQADPDVLQQEHRQEEDRKLQIAQQALASVAAQQAPESHLWISVSSTPENARLAAARIASPTVLTSAPVSGPQTPGVVSPLQELAALPGVIPPNEQQLVAPVAPASVNPHARLQSPQGPQVQKMTPPADSPLEIPSLPTIPASSGFCANLC